jgi:hypothetical protein
MIMASYAESFGYTPAQFFTLTLKQVAAFGRYAEKREDDAKRSSKSKGSSSSSSGSINTLEELVGRFGTQEAKERLMGDG